MRRKRSPDVTLILEAAFASGRNIVRGATAYGREHGPWRFHYEWRNTDIFFPHWMDTWRGDGLIGRIETRRIAEALAHFRKPVVDVLGELPQLPFPLVRVDDGAVGRMAAEHLLERGFRIFGFCGLANRGWSIRRREGFVAALAREGVEAAIHERALRDDRPREWAAEARDLAAWLSGLRKPAALMVCNDLRAYEVLEACHGAGIAVPDDIALVGVDDDETVCEVCHPPLSSVITDDRRVGYEAARLLARLMAGGRWNGKPILIPPKGVRHRLSSDVLAIEDGAVVAAIQFIREHAREGVTVDQVAKRVPVCRSLLQRRFKRALNRTLHEEIARVRLEHAKFLLEESDLSLAQVAEKSGFTHHAYLSAVFRKRLGQTPHHYRRQFRRLA